MDTYKAEGTTTSNIDTNGTKMTVETAFSILLKKPNQYLISWAQQPAVTGMPQQSGAVWSDGTQPFLYMGILDAYSKMSGDEMALAAATGISGGAAFTIPSLFLPRLKGQPVSFSRLKDAKIQTSEKVAGEDCYVISGPSEISKEETFWISKTSYLIRQYRRSFESPEKDAEAAEAAEVTDEQLEEALKAMGMDVTEASKQNMKEMMDKSSKMLENSDLKGFTTELHASISSPELNKDDFTFALPNGTILKDSLFGEMLGGHKGIPASSTNPATE